MHRERLKHDIPDGLLDKKQHSKTVAYHIFNLLSGLDFRQAF